MFDNDKEGQWVWKKNGDKWIISYLYVMCNNDNYIDCILLCQVHLRARAVQDQPPQPHQLQALQIPPVPGGRHEAGEGERSDDDDDDDDDDSDDDDSDDDDKVDYYLNKRRERDAERKRSDPEPGAEQPEQQPNRYPRL